MGSLMEDDMIEPLNLTRIDSNIILESGF